MAISRKPSKSRRPTARNGRAESAKAVEKREAIERLKEYVKPGDTISTVLRHVSASGMMRRLDVYHFYCKSDGKVGKHYLSYNAAIVLGYKAPSMGKEGISVGGAGMDMGFHVVYELSRVLFGDGYALNHEWI